MNICYELGPWSTSCAPVSKPFSDGGFCFLSQGAQGLNGIANTAIDIDSNVRGSSLIVTITVVPGVTCPWGRVFMDASGALPTWPLCT